MESPHSKAPENQDDVARAVLSAGRERPVKRDGSVHSRRRLLGMGAGMTPLVLTLASRPALGNECTNSALLSGNNSTSTRRDPNYCYYQELDPISSAFVAEQQRITTELNAAWAAGDSTLAAQLQDEYYALVDDYNAQMAALKSKYSVYPGFSA